MQKTPELIRLLCDAEFKFIIIGGVAAIVHGSATFTVDLDVTAPFSVENMGRLVEALDAYNPRHALTADRLPLELKPKALTEFKNLYVETDIGRLDILGETSVGDYRALRSNAVETSIGGQLCLVIGIDDLITAKERAGREKDRQVVTELKAIREIRNRD